MEWEGIDGGGGGNILFMKPKKGININDLPKNFKGRDDAQRFQLMVMNERENVYTSNIKIGITVP